MQITVQTDSMSFMDSFTPQITIIETDHGLTVRSAGPTEPLAAPSDLQFGRFTDGLPRARGVPRHREGFELILGDVPTTTW